MIVVDASAIVEMLLRTNDALYVALAEALDAPLLTADERLAATHGHRAVVETI